MDRCYEVSVAVLTYNSDWDKLYYTLKSIILQKNVRIQIVIADDCSKDTHFDRVEAFFQSIKFADYVLLKSDKNNGIVINSLNCLNYVRFAYVKGMSPGDVFAYEYALYDMMSLAEREDSAALFSDAYYCRSIFDINPCLNVLAYPQMVRAYGGSKNRIIKYSYGCLDYILGATVLYKASILREVLGKMAGKIIYLEDFVLKLMAIDGYKISYLPKESIFYEYGLGISTCKQEFWNEALRKDKCEFINLVHQIYGSNKKIIHMTESTIELMNCKDKHRIRRIWMSSPYRLFYMCKKRFFPRKTKVDVDIENKQFIDAVIKAD